MGRGGKQKGVKKEVRESSAYWLVKKAKKRRKKNKAKAHAMMDWAVKRHDQRYDHVQSFLENHMTSTPKRRHKNDLTWGRTYD